MVAAQLYHSIQSLLIIIEIDRFMPSWIAYFIKYIIHLFRYDGSNFSLLSIFMLVLFYQNELLFNLGISSYFNAAQQWNKLNGLLNEIQFGCFHYNIY